MTTDMLTLGGVKMTQANCHHQFLTPSRAPADSNDHQLLPYPLFIKFKWPHVHTFSSMMYEWLMALRISHIFTFNYSNYFVILNVSILIE